MEMGRRPLGGSPDLINADSQTFNILFPGAMHFNKASTAGAATFKNSGILTFHNTSDAGTADIKGGEVDFFDSSNAGNANIDAAIVLKFCHK